MGPSGALVCVSGQPRSIYSHPCSGKGQGGRKGRAVALQGTHGKQPPPTTTSPSQHRQTHSRSHCSAAHTTQFPSSHAGEGDPWHQPLECERLGVGKGTLILQAGMRGSPTELSLLARTGIAPPNSHPTGFTASPISLTFFSFSDSTQAREGGALPPTSTPESSFHSASKRERRKGRANLSCT